jgi:hypothetical protein
MQRMKTAKLFTHLLCLRWGKLHVWKRHGELPPTEQQDAAGNVDEQGQVPPLDKHAV